VSLRRIARNSLLFGASLFVSTFAASAAEMVQQLDMTPFHATPDVTEFILAIAPSTAKAPGGSDGSHRVVTLGRNEKGELVVNGFQVVALKKQPVFQPGTVAVLIVHKAGECQPPYGDDAYGIMNRVFTFVVDHNGENVWELGYQNALGTFWLAKSPTETGPTETYNLDPAKYKTYACEKYQ